MASGTIPFTITETAGIARDGGTLSSMNDPIAIPLRFDEAKTSTAAFRVIDTVTGLPINAAFRSAHEPLTHSRCVGGARWGNFGNTGHRIKLVHIDLQPVLNANETRQYNLITSGGSGDAPGGMTVTTASAHYEINTGLNGIRVRIPRTGPMSVIRYLEMLNSAGAPSGQIIINSDLSGLWMHGISADGQDADYVSRLDTSGTGADNGGNATETARPGTYYTSLLFNNSQRVGVKIDNVRLFATAGGTAFMGKQRQSGTAGTATPQVFVVDVLLWFFRNSAAIQGELWPKGTGGDANNAGGLRSDVAILSGGLDLVPTFTGTSTKIATRDETDPVDKVAQATATSATTIRQRYSMVNGSSYNHTLEKTGPFVFTGTPKTQREAFFDVTASDNSRGLLMAVRNWVEMAPMGWAHFPTATATMAAGTLRFEMWNPAQGYHHRILRPGSNPAVYDPTDLAYQPYQGWKWHRCQFWLVAHAGALTPTQMRQTVQALAGKHENQFNRVYSPTTETGPGQQMPSLIGEADANHWDSTLAWRRIPPATCNVPSLLNTPGLLGLPGTKPGSVSRWDDCSSQQDDWMDTYIDTGLVQNGPSGILRSVVEQNSFPNFTEVGPWHWMCYPAHSTSVAAEACGANDYELWSYPFYHWLRKRNRGWFTYARDGVFHHISADQFHNFYGLDSAGLMHGKFIDISGVSAGYHGSQSNAFAGFEYQQQNEAASLWFLRTGHPMLIESLQHYMNPFNTYLYGASASGVFDARQRALEVPGILQANRTTITNIDTSAFLLPSANLRTYVRPLDPAIPVTGISSSGEIMSGAFPLFTGATLTARRAHAIGTTVRHPVTSGTSYTVIELVSDTQWRVKPTPSVALSNATVEILFKPTRFAQFRVLSKTATTLTGEATHIPLPNAPGPVTVTSVPDDTPRLSGWQLAALVGMRKVFGATITNAQGTFNLDERIRDVTLHLIHTEQVYSHPTVRASALGGTGTWWTFATDGFALQFAYGRYGTRVHTYANYPVQPMMYSHELMDQLSTQGLDGGVFTAATRTAALDLLVRWGKNQFMGSNGLSPIKGAQATVLRRIPFVRGGDLASPTSYQRIRGSFCWSVSEEPTRASRVGNDFLYSAENMDSLTTLEPFDGRFIAQGTDSTGGVAFGGDILAYVALKRWHATNQTALRDAWKAQAMLCWAQTAFWPHANSIVHPAYGAYASPAPSTWTPRRTGILANPSGWAEGPVKGKHWLLKHGAYVQRLALEGFTGEVVDAVAPTETQALVLVAKTTNSITVDGPPAEDNSGVIAGYFWFLDNVQQGALSAGTSKQFTGLSAGQTYSIKRKAQDPTGNTSGDSNVLSIQTDVAGDTTPPTVPTGLDGSADNTTATLTFPPSTDVGGTGVALYRVQRNGVEVGTVPHPTTTVLGLQGTAFTINGTPTFLLGVNYYDVLNWRVSDLDGFGPLGIRCCRIWMASPATWIGTGGKTGRSALTAAGNWIDNAKRDTVIAFVDACAARGIICDVVIQDCGSSPPSIISNTQTARRQAITTVATTLADKTNCMFDLCNEHSAGAQPVSDANLTAWDLKGAFLAAAPDRLWHISSCCDHQIDDAAWTVSAAQRSVLAFHYNTLGQPICTDHQAGPTDADWENKFDNQVAALRAELEAIGKTIPIYLDEPAWADAGNAADTNSTGASWLASIGVAKDAGAAGFVIDALIGVDMTTQSYLAGMSAKAATVVNGAGALVNEPVRLTFVDTNGGAGLTPGTDYTYRVQAEDHAQNLSAFSATKVLTTTGVIDTTPPAAPSTPSLGTITSASVGIGWSPNTETDILNYDVLRDTVSEVDGELVPDGSPVTLGPVTHPTVTFTDAGRTPSTRYAYQLVARDTSANESGPSSAVIVQTLRLARTFSGGSRLRFTGSVPVTDYPITRTLWVKPTALGNQFLTASANPSSDMIYLALKMQANGLVQALRVNGGSSFPAATSTTPLVAGQWALVVGIFESATLAKCYVIPLGGLVPTAGQDTTNVPFPSGLTALTVGNCERLTLATSQPFAGAATDLTLWNVALTEAELAVLAAGVSPRRVRRQSIAYHNLINGEAASEVPEIGPGTLDPVLTVGTTDGPAIEILFADENPVEEDDQPPTIPVIQSPSEITATTVTFAWLASTDAGTAGMGGYRIRRRDSLGGSPTLVTTVDANTLTFQDTGLEKLHTYFYTVAAFDLSANANESGESETLIVNTTGGRNPRVNPVTAVDRVPRV